MSDTKHGFSNFMALEQVDYARALEADRDAWKAKYEAAIEALEAGAKYLDELSANLIDNDADMLIDRCDDPAEVAGRMRATRLVSDHDRAKEASDAG